MTLRGRITQQYKEGMTFHALLHAVYPPALYPKAWTAPTRTHKQGTPACMMPFVAALKNMGADYNAAENRVTIPKLNHNRNWKKFVY